MKRLIPLFATIVPLTAALVGHSASSPSATAAAAAIAEGKLPAGYRDWRLISVAREEGELDDIRAVLGNDEAIRAYRGATPYPFPDGTIIARLAWSYDSSAENNKTFGREQSHDDGIHDGYYERMVHLQNWTTKATSSRMALLLAKKAAVASGWRKRRRGSQGGSRQARNNRLDLPRRDG